MATDTWKEVRLAEVCEAVDYGYTASAKIDPVGPKFLRITDIVGGPPNWEHVPHCDIDARRVDRFRLHHGDIVIARTGATTGFSAYIDSPPDSVFASYLIRLRVEQTEDARFISYFLKSPAFWNYMHGVLGEKSAQPNANAKTLTAIKVSLPPLPEQRAIAHILGTLDDKIELNRRMNQTLEGIARALFKSWFVDFDPVRASAEGRQPVGMDAETAALFPDSFQESELGLIPSEWGIGVFADLAYQHRQQITPGNQPEGLFLLHSIPAFDDGKQPVLERGEQIGSNKFTVPRESILISRLNPRIPRVWMVPGTETHQRVCSTEFFVAVPNEGWGQGYVFCLTQSEAFRASLQAMVTGTSGSHQRVRPADLSSLQMVVPPPRLTSYFEELAMSLLRRVQVGTAESQTLAEIRDALLPKLISGELRVPDAEKVLAQSPL